MLTMHEPTYILNKWMHMVRRCRKWKREQTTLISQIILLCWNATMHEPVKSNLPPENKWMHTVRQYRKWKREQTTLISQIILLCWNVLTMHGPLKSNLPTEKKWMHMVRRYRKRKGEETTLISQIILACWNANHAWTSQKVTYILRINECT